MGDAFYDANLDVENPFRKLNHGRFDNFGKRFPIGEPTRDINAMTPDEIKKLCDAAIRSPNKLLLPLIQFLAATGLRRGKAYELKWKDIDRRAGLIHVRKSKSGRIRKVPLDHKSLEALSLINRRGEYIFVRSNGQRPHPDSFLKPLQRAAKRAGIQKRVDLHTLRHSFGSNKIAVEKWGLKTLSMVMGHADISTTANIYMHLHDGDYKIRDEFRFDNVGKKENSKIVVNEQEKAVLSAVKELVQVINQAKFSDLKNASAVVSCSYLRTNANECEPVRMTEKEGFLAALMLRKPGNPKNKKTAEAGEDPCLLISLTYFQKNQSRCPDSNRGPTLYESVALPTELHRHISQVFLSSRYRLISPSKKFRLNRR